MIGQLISYTTACWNAQKLDMGKEMPLQTFREAMDSYIAFLRWQLLLEYMDHLVVFWRSSVYFAKDQEHVRRVLHKGVVSLKLKNLKWFAPVIN